MAPQIITNLGNFTLDFNQLGFCAFPLFLQTPDLDLQMNNAKLTFYLKRGLWSSHKCWIDFAWQYSQACGHPCCLCTFSYQFLQSTLHLICFDTALCEQPPFSNGLLWLILLWRVSMIVFWTIAKSVVFPLLGFQSTRDTQNLYCMDGHLMKLKCKYSNILRYGIFDFHEL